MYKSHIHSDIQEKLDMEKYVPSEFISMKFNNKQN